MSKKIDVDDELIRKLADIMDETGLTEIEIGLKMGGFPQLFATEIEKK